MAEADWTVATDSLDANSVRRGSTMGVAPPNGGGFVYAFNSAASVVGASSLFHNGANFAPYLEGASIRGAFQKGAGGGATGSTPLIILNQEGPSVNDSAYMLCFADNDPAKLQLVKGAPVNGPAGVVLRESDDTFDIGDWLHLRLDAVLNANGDVALTIFKNDLVANPIGGAFVWTAVAGMTVFIDDALGINSGSLPLAGGRAGFGMWCNEVTRRAYHANIELSRQIP